MGSPVVSAVTFNPEGIEVMFMIAPDDVRNDGMLVATRSYAISARHPAYKDEVAQIVRLVTELVDDVHEDFPTTPVFDPSSADDEDDDRGMGE